MFMVLNNVVRQEAGDILEKLLLDTRLIQGYTLNRGEVTLDLVSSMLLTVTDNPTIKTFLRAWSKENPVSTMSGPRP